MFEESAANAIKWRIGNCQEKAAIAFMLFREYIAANDLPEINEKISVEFMFIEEEIYDHGFIALNRNANTNINKPNQWNDDVVICDPWANEVYTLAEIRDKKIISREWPFIEKNCEQINAFPLVSFIGAKFNDDKSHSPEWEMRAATTNKWWKAQHFFTMKRVDKNKKENVQELLHKKNFVTT